jgi:hypothetical protein
VKVESAIKLEGPLSRNRALSSLSPGDSVRVILLEKIDSMRAVIDLLGNRVTAHFSEGVPDKKSVLLTITGNSGDKLVFKSETDAKSSQLLTISLLSDKLPDALFLRTIVGSITDIFVFNRLMMEHRLKRRLTDHKKNFDRLLSLGLTSKDLSALSTLGLNKLPSFFITLANLVMDKNQLMDETTEELETKLQKLSRDDFQMLMNSIFDESSALFLLNIDSTYHWFNILFEEDYFCVSFEFEKTGLIQLVAKENISDIRVSIFFESADYRKKFLSNIDNLESLVLNSIKKVNLMTYLLSESVNEINKEIAKAVQIPVVDIRV